jgi:hypothetical protein
MSVRGNSAAEHPHGRVVSLVELRRGVVCAPASLLAEHAGAQTTSTDNS